MQTQDAPAEFLIKFWPWFEANRKRLIYTAVAVVVILFIWFFYTTQQEQKAVEAGQAYTKLQLNLAANQSAQQMAEACQKIAAQYSGTLAAERAQIQAATLLFGAGRYEEAQAQFSKFINLYRDSSLLPAARLGLAASLEAQPKLDAAVTEYHAVVTAFPNSNEALTAKFALGRVMELQGKLTEAAGYYQDVARSPLAGSYASEAGQRFAQIQAKLPVKSAAKS